MYSILVENKPAMAGSENFQLDYFMFIVLFF